MKDVQWIKIDIGLINNPKINEIRREDDGDEMVLIWIMLLCLAGRCNADGKVFISEGNPYTAKGLAYDLRFPTEMIENALSLFAKHNMITVEDGIICVKNWSEYQNVQALDDIREQGRLRKQKERERKSKMRDSHTTVTGQSRDSHVTCHVTEEDMSRDVTQQNKNKNKIKNIKENNTKEKSAASYGMNDFELVDYDALLGSHELGEASRAWIRYKHEKGEDFTPQMFSDFVSVVRQNAKKYGEAKVIDCIKKSAGNGYVGIIWQWLEKKSDNKSPNAFNNFEQNNYDIDALEKALGN